MRILNYILAFALQLKKGTEDLSQGSPIVLDSNDFFDMAALFRTASNGLLGLC